MKCLELFGTREYYKIMIVSLVPDRCQILKGPQDEMILAEFLKDDHHIGRYEKMLRLVVRQKIEKSAQESVSHLLSPGYLGEQFERGRTKVTCSYLREIDGIMQPVAAMAFPRKFGEQGKLQEFMIYISGIK